MTALNTDHATEKNHKLALGLSGLLADTYTLYFTTQVYHWNVEGPHFHSLHVLFMEQYTELAGAVDVVAEFIRARGYYTPTNLTRMRKHTKLSEPKDAPASAEEMLNHLITSHQHILDRTVEIAPLAQAVHDEVAIDLLNERGRVHGKAIWMLNSQLGKSSRLL